MTADISEHDLGRDDLEDFLQEPVSGVTQTANDPEPEPKEPSITGVTVAELAGTITGFDRIAITKMFGAPVNRLSPDMGIYVGLFVWHRHSGMSDQDAFDAACNTTAEDAQRYFEADDEIDDDHPETESGKDR